MRIGMGSRLACGMVVLALSTAALVAAENTDPAGDGSQYAYGENVGWLNAEPQGDGGPGLELRDFVLLGYLWGENVGWISMSCDNDGSCGRANYGVRNDGTGVLEGYAWGENVGWVNFAPSSAGVVVDPATGEFSGRAWAENVGWISFASAGAVDFGVTSAWRCDPGPSPPSGTVTLSLDETGAGTELSWVALEGASAYDIVHGDVDALRAGGGDFAAATKGCLARKIEGLETQTDETPHVGNAIWFLVRGVNCGGTGSYDGGGAQQEPGRDEEISQSALACS